MNVVKVIVWVAVVVVMIASCWLFLMSSTRGSQVNDYRWFRPLIQRNITPEHFAFYSPFTRAWEFVAGVLVALLLRLKVTSLVIKAGSLFTYVGAVLVMFAVAWASRFPEIQHDGNWSTNTSATLAVVLGTMFWIFGGSHNNLIRQLISIKPLTLIGDWSYSVYLLHWPIWVLLITSFNQGWEIIATAFVLSLGFGWLQFRYVEDPIRLKKNLPTIKTLQFAGVFGLIAAVGFVAMSYATPVIAMHLTGKDPDELSVHIIEKPCAAEVFELESAQSCQFLSATNQGTAILVGDSMAKSLSDGFVKAANTQGLTGYVFSYPGCAFLIFDSPYSATSACVSWRTDVLSALQQLQPKVLMIANLNTLYVETPFEDWTIANTELAWGSEIMRTLEQLSELQIPVIIAQPPPRFAYDLRYDLSLLWRNTVTEPRVAVLERREKMNQIEANAIVGFQFVRPIVDFTDLFCNSNICDPKVNNKYMFEDNDHLSVDGSIYVSDVLERALAEALIK
jgi:hypothetical protein